MSIDHEAGRFQIRGFEAHQHNGRPWYSAQVVTRENRMFVDNRWGSWSCYAIQPRGKGDRPEPGKRCARKAVVYDLELALRKREPSRKTRKAAA